jgi:hypothetical protein
MAGPGRSMGHVLHGEDAFRISDQLAWVSDFVSLGFVMHLWASIWLGEQAFTKKQVDASSCTAFFVEDAHTG